MAVEDGGLRLSEDLELPHEYIFSVIETRLFERIMRPSLGSPELIFSAVNDPALIVEQFRQALETQIEGVDSWNITGDIADNGIFTLTINYSISSLPQPPIQYQLVNE